MINLSKIGLALVFLLFVEGLNSQSLQSDPQLLISEIIEEMSSKTDNEIDFTPIVDDLMYLFENPINLNQCTIEDLSKLVFLSDFQIQGLWDYIQTNGLILSLYELQLIYGFDRADIQRMSTFVMLGKSTDTKSLKDIITMGRHEVILKTGTILENQVGYKNYSSPSASRYLGSKYSLYTRYNYQYKDKMEWGLITDKDAGEQFFKGNNLRGFDYLSGYLSIANVWRIKKLVIGDYDAGFGQGLTFWSNLSAGKSSDPMGIRKRARGLVKHSSANENNFLRGIGVTIPLRRVDLTLFGSYKKIDANIEDSLVNGGIYFSSLPESGLHRTSTEIASKDAVSEMIMGGNFFYNGRKIKAGLTLSHVKIDGNYIVDSSLYKLYESSVTGRTNIGFNLEGYIKKHHLFGEAAFDPQSDERAILIGGLFKFTSLVGVSVLGRKYTRGYTNIYTSAFSEGSGTYNENGLFMGISIQPAKGLKFSAYSDIFSFPWLKYRVNAPSVGHEYLIQTEYRLNSNFTGLVRYRLKKSEQNFTSEFNKMVIVIPQKMQSARLQLAYVPDKGLMLRSRFDFSSYSNDSTHREYGYVLSQDIGYTHPKYPISISFRFAIFDTDSWNTRIYNYESDMLYTFSVPAYSSNGTRMYILLKYSPTDRIDCWFRWSQTFYSDQIKIGQGLDLIEGNKKSDLRVMVRVKF